MIRNSFYIRAYVMMGLCAATLLLIGELSISGCTPQQAKQVQDASILALGNRETVCLLIDQAAASSTDKTVLRAQELCNSGEELQGIIDSLATPCESR